MDHLIGAMLMILHLNKIPNLRAASSFIRSKSSLFLHLIQFLRIAARV